MSITHIFTDRWELYDSLIEAARIDGWVMSSQDSDTTWQYVRFKRGDNTLWLEWIKPGTELHYSRKLV